MPEDDGKRMSSHTQRAESPRAYRGDHLPAVRMIFHHSRGYSTGSMARGAANRNRSDGQPHRRAELIPRVRDVPQGPKIRDVTGPAPAAELMTRHSLRGD